MDLMLNKVMMLVLKLEENMAYAITNFLLMPLQEVLTKTSPRGGQ